MKLKRIASAAIAAVLATAMAVPVFASGRNETIEGDGYIGWGQQYEERTPAPTAYGVTAGDDTDPLNVIPPSTILYGDNLIAEGTDTSDPAYDIAKHLENIGGGAINVTWPNGDVSQTTVNAVGQWQVTVPSTVTLVKGEIIVITQKVDDKATSYPTKVVIDGGNGLVDPEPPVEPPYEFENPEDYLVLSLPASFYWYVNQETLPEIVSGVEEYEIKTEGLVFDHTYIDNTDPLNPVTVTETKEFDAPVEVSLVRFEQTNRAVLDVKGDLDLYFTGDFGAKISQSIEGGYSTRTALGTIQSNLGNDPAWNAGDDTLTFGFTGAYTKTENGKVVLPLEGQVPHYEMLLNFKIDSTYYDDVIVPGLPGNQP